MHSLPRNRPPSEAEAGLHSHRSGDLKVDPAMMPGVNIIDGKVALTRSAVGRLAAASAAGRRRARRAE